MNKKRFFWSFGIIASLMIVTMVTINVNLSQNNNDNGLSTILLANVEALISESDWMQRYRIRAITVEKTKITCCVSSVSTDSCDYGIIGCA
jgi:hypothetical protein